MTKATYFADFLSKSKEWLLGNFRVSVASSRDIGSWNILFGRGYAFN